MFCPSSILRTCDARPLKPRQARAFLTWPVLLVLIATLPVSWAREHPTAHQAAEIEALVNKAAEVLEEQGSKAFGEFRKKGSFWRYGDIYLFVVDIQGIVLFNAARPNREGRDLLDERTGRDTACRGII
jgi:cytochrome c